MTWEVETVPIADPEYFETLNGLWKGKKEPFIEAGVIRNTNFTPSGLIDYSNVAYLDVETGKTEPSHGSTAPRFTIGSLPQPTSS